MSYYVRSAATPSAGIPCDKCGKNLIEFLVYELRPKEAPIITYYHKNCLMAFLDAIGPKEVEWESKWECVFSLFDSYQIMKK
jgi:hypothetical protein